MSGEGWRAAAHAEAGAKRRGVMEKAAPKVRGRPTMQDDIAPKPARSNWRELVLFSMEGAAIAVVLDVLFYEELLALPFLFVLVPCFVRTRIYARREAQRRQQLRDFRVVLDSLAVSLRAGYSVERAIPEAARTLEQILGAKNPMTAAWRNIVKKLSLKQPPDAAIREFANACDAEEIQSFAEVFASAKRLGGNLSRIVGRTAETISRKLEVEEEIQTLLAAKKLEQRIMSMMPLGIILYMRLTSPGYLDVLYHSIFGAGIMTICLLAWLGTLYWGQRIIHIEV